MKRNILFASSMVALLSIVLVAYAWANRMRQANSIQIVTIGHRWFDVLGRDLRVFGMDGQPRGEFWTGRLELGYLSVHYSPDGKWVIILDAEYKEGRHMWRASLYTADNLSRSLYSFDDVQTASWSPKGDRLAVTKQGDRNGSEASRSVSVISLACLFESTYCTPAEDWIADGSWPTWSPDGAKLLYRNELAQVVVEDLVSRQKGQLPIGEQEDCYDFSWSPSGRYAAMLCKDSQVFAFDFETNTLEDLRLGWVDSFQWTPDADTLVFLSCHADKGLCQTPILWNTEVDSTNALFSLSLASRLSRSKHHGLEAAGAMISWTQP